MTESPIRFPALAEVPEAARIETATLSNRYLIGGEIREWKGESAEVRSPICWRGADGELERALVGRMPMLDAAEAMAALAAAKKAWDHGRGEWPSSRVARRIGCLERFVDGMIRVREEVVRLLMWEIGKPRKDSESELDRTVVYMRDTIEALKEQDRAAARFQMEEGTIGQIRRSPLGVVLCMGPFNYPLNETFTTLIPAVLMGNTVVSKLPKFGGLLHVPLFEAMRDAFPPGVVNIIQGDGAKIIGPIMQSGDVDVLAFIGTSRVANILKKQHPRPNRLRCITGLEAKNPAIVLPDADLDVAVAECVNGALSFNGQRCTAIKLILVHRSIAETFVGRLADAVDALPAGMPWEPGVKLTPLVEDDKPGWMSTMVKDATDKGARVVNALGGQTRGTFYRPAVVYPVTPEMQLYSQEQFGPIVPVAIFDDDSQIDDFMRTTQYGQQVSLFGRDARRLAGLVDTLVNQVSRININTQCRRGPDTFPFTGRKDSAEGTLSVTDALRAFSIRATVATASNETNKRILGDIVTGRLSSFLSTDFVL